MKIKFTYVFFLLAFSLFLFTSSEEGRADAANWGNTGAPGDQLTTSGQPRVCQSCHNSGGSLMVTQAFDLIDAAGNSVLTEGYIPGEPYTVKVQVLASGATPDRYGFQVLCLNGAEGVNAPEVSDWSNPTGNAKIATASNTGRTYLEHNHPNNTTNIFEVTWTPPATLDGDVTFYVVSNAVDGNGETSGDASTGGTITVNRTFPISTNDFGLNADIQLFPVPVSNVLNIQFEANNAMDLVYEIINVNGKKLTSGNLQIAEGTTINNLDVAAIPSGAYFLNLYNEEQVISKRFVK